MGPDIHFDMMMNRHAELHAEAVRHRRVREAQAVSKSRSRGQRNRALSFLRKFSAA
ncbi:hypothetical protein ACFFMN_08880 [Planobispora siamensis]|uniref:Uncharacterized protein n=1 Tax=Planobispora siamensis TaxID=936338 RepID=A0A8J3SDE7_9ACTN|nr:hypothetical protein [Planobispora siamensis]GIH91095.1 hypothetical protein Psi01_17250 [Planobispora siamensis]